MLPIIVNYVQRTGSLQKTAVLLSVTFERVHDQMLANPSVTTPEQFAEIFKQDVARWPAIIKTTGATVP
jgi:hypothetical protein